MAIVVSQNNLAQSTVQQGLFTLKQLLKSVGWVVTASGDGLALFSTSGDVITSGVTGAGGLQNLNAWFAIRSPDGLNAFSFQNGSGSASGDAWRVRWSPGGIFSTGGTPSATISASVTGGTVATMRGGGTDAAPSFTGMLSTLFPRSVVCAASNTAPYFFWFACLAGGVGSAGRSSILFDSLVNTVPGDVNPYVWVQDGNGDLFSGFIQTEGTPGGTTYFHAFWAPSLSPSIIVSTGCLAYTGASQGVIANLLQDPISSKDLMTPVAFAGAVDPGYWKGVSQNAYWKGVNRASGDTATVSTARDKIYMGNFVLPWDGSLPVI